MSTVRRYMAVHEAGHAVVAMALGKDISELRINEDGAHCISYAPHPKRSYHACSALGGVLACALYCREFPELAEWNNWEHCHDDMRLFNQERSGMTYRQGRRIALEILRGSERLILELASILERDGYVDHSNAPAAIKAD